MHRTCLGPSNVYMKWASSYIYLRKRSDEILCQIQSLRIGGGRRGRKWHPAVGLEPRRVRAIISCRRGRRHPVSNILKPAVLPGSLPSRRRPRTGPPSPFPRAEPPGRAATPGAPAPSTARAGPRGPTDWIPLTARPGGTSQPSVGNPGTRAPRAVPSGCGGGREEAGRPPEAAGSLRPPRTRSVSADGGLNPRRTPWKMGQGRHQLPRSVPTNWRLHTLSLERTDRF